MALFPHGKPANLSALCGNDAAIALHGARHGGSRWVSNAHHVQNQEKSSRPRPRRAVSVVYGEGSGAFLSARARVPVPGRDYHWSFDLGYSVRALAGPVRITSRNIPISLQRIRPLEHYCGCRKRRVAEGGP